MEGFKDLILPFISEENTYWCSEQWKNHSELSYHSQLFQQGDKYTVHVAEGGLHTPLVFPLSSIPIRTQQLQEILNAAPETIHHQHNQNTK